LWFKAYTCSIRYSAIPRIIFSLYTSIGLSSLRLVIALRIRAKESRRLLYIMRATSIIILRPFVNKRTRRIITRVVFIRILLCRSTIVFSIETGLSNS
jgi:hypothetical protein